MQKSECKAFSQRIFNLYVDHPQVKNIWKKLDSMREFTRNSGKNAPALNLFLVGESGVGKSTLTQKYAEKYPPYIEVDEFGTERDIIPVVWMEMPHPFSSANIKVDHLTHLC